MSRKRLTPEMLEAEARKEYEFLSLVGYGPAVVTREDRVRVLAKLLIIPRTAHHLLFSDAEAFAAAEKVVPK